MNVTLEDIQKVQHLRLCDAAATFHMGATQFKKVCRGLGITRWPQRKVCFFFCVVGVLNVFLFVPVKVLTKLALSQLQSLDALLKHCKAEALCSSSERQKQQVQSRT